MDGVFSVMAIMSLVDNITAPLKAVGGALAATEGKVARLSNVLGSLTKKMIPLALAAGVVLAALVPGIGVAAEFQAAVSNLGAISRATASDMAIMEKSALDLGASTAFSASQVVQAQTELAKKGFAANQVVAAMPGLLDLAASTQSDLALASSVASGALNAFHLEASKAGAVANIIAAASTSSATDIQGLSASLANAGAIAASAGADFAIVAAMTGKMADANIPAAVTGTAIKIMFQRLAAPVGEAANTLQRLGIATKDAHGNMLPIFDVLGGLESSLAGMGSADRTGALGRIFGSEAVGGVTALLGQGVGAVAAYADKLRNSAGVAAEMAAKQLNNLKGAVTILGSAWEGLQIVVGKVFLPALAPLIHALSSVIGWLASVAATDVGQTIIGIAGGVSIAVLAFTAFVAISWGLTAVLPFVSASLAVVGGAVAAISAPVWIVIGALLALWLAFRSNFGGIADFATAAWNKISLVWRGLQAVFASLTDGVGQIKGQLASDVEAAGLVGALTTVGRMVYRLQQITTGFAEGFAMAWTEVVAVVSPIADSLVAGFGPLFSLLGQLASLLFGASAATDASGWRTFGVVIGAVVGAAFKTLAFAIRLALFPLELLFTIIAEVADFFSGLTLFEAGRKLIGTFVDGIRSMIMAPVNMVEWGLQKVRNLLPFSDAREGPLSSLTASGAAIMQTLGIGIHAAAPGLAGATARAMAGVAAAAAISLAPISPAIAAPGLPEASAIQQPGKASVTQSGKQVVIHSLTVHLSNVQDADGFVQALQQLVEGHDA